MTYKLESPFNGYPSIETLLPAVGPTNTPWPPIQPGVIVRADDSVWGPGEFVFGKFGGAVRQYGLCALTPTWNAVTRTYDQLFTEVANLGNTAASLYVAMAESGPTGAVLNQFGWFMATGLVPVNSIAAVAAGVTVGIAGAGQAGANAAGKQINGATSAQSGAATLVKAVAGSGNNNLLGGTTVQVNNLDGVFVGSYASGAGVGAAAIVSALDRINNVVTLSVANAAAVTGNITFTFNNAVIFYNVLQLNRPTAQGAIT